LRASEERYRQAMETMSEGYAILGRDWTYLFVNQVNAEASEQHGPRT
jgi:PAS domain-containing protein